MGSSARGGNPASVGHLYGFGNTEEKYRVNILGCKARGNKATDRPFDHSTGAGWVAGRRGDYYDALVNKRSKVVPFIVESYGGIAPHSRAAIRRLARRATAKGARDRTIYGETRISTRSLYTHHAQRIVKNVVYYTMRSTSSNRLAAGVRRGLMAAPRARVAHGCAAR